MVMVLVGASHHDLPLEALDPLVAAAEQVFDDVTGPAFMRGAVLLTTCNRVEYYLDADLFHDAIDHVTALMSAAAGLSHDHVRDSLRVTVGTPIAAHLFSVAAGLDSLVVGENEISGQVGDALEVAREKRTTSAPLERLFQQASRTARQITSTTGLGAAGRSLVSVGLDLITERHGDMPTKSALVIGTGAYARVATQALRDRDCTRILSFSASGRAETFASSHELEPVHHDDLATVLNDIDLIVACSGVHHYVLDAHHAQIIATRGRALPIIDLALHSDVHPEVRSLADVDYIDLTVIGEHAPSEHADVIESAQDLVRSAVETYDDTELGRNADPTVIALRTRFDETVTAEVDRVRRRLGDDAAEVVAQSLHRVTSVLLHTPTMRARQMAKIGDGLDYARAIHLVFGIDVPLDSES